MTANTTPAPRTLWAYVYEIVPPKHEDDDRFRAIKALLDHEQSKALHAARTWTGRFVVDQRVARILIVSDSPDQNRAINRQLEAELNVLDTAFVMSVPMVVVGAAAQPLTVEAE